MISWRPGLAEALLVCEALLALGCERRALEQAARSVGRWDRVLTLARAYAVSESLWAALALRGMTGAVPADARERFEDDHSAAAARCAPSRGGRPSSGGAWRGGDRVRDPKGPALLASHYPALGAPTRGDLDLLLRPREVARAAEVAERHGARARDVDLDGGPSVAHHHHLPVMRPRAAWRWSCTLPSRAPMGDRCRGSLRSIRSRRLARTRFESPRPLISRASPAFTCSTTTTARDSSSCATLPIAARSWALARRAGRRSRRWDVVTGPCARRAPSWRPRSRRSIAR